MVICLPKLPFVHRICVRMYGSSQFVGGTLTLMSKGKGWPSRSKVKGFISIRVASTSRKTCAGQAHIGGDEVTVSTYPSNKRETRYEPSGWCQAHQAHTLNIDLRNSPTLVRSSRGSLAVRGATASLVRPCVCACVHVCVYVCFANLMVN
jgi:hypothetical protein